MTGLRFGVSDSLPYMRRLGWWGVCAAALVGCVAVAQTATTMVSIPVPLLGPKMGTAVRTGDVVAGEDAAQADATHAAALTEDGLERFSRGTYGKTQVQAMQFNDASGARAAYSLYLQNNAQTLKWDGIPAAVERSVVDGRTIVLAGTVVLIAEKDASQGTAKEIVSALPKIGGSRSQPPLLPRSLPAKGLVAGSVRYALGPAGYAAAGGALPGDKLGWEKSGEAVTAEYADRRGKESLTLLLYPTPQIAGDHMRSLMQELGAGAKVRREGELVAVAQGTFSADDAQNLVENAHLNNVVSFDKPMPLEFHTEIRKTYSLVQSIFIFSAVGGLAAVVLGLFLGFGRAGIRKLQGKDAAADVEFLSLHLDPQNAPPRFERPGSEDGTGV